jgi:hypothetical protein
VGCEENKKDREAETQFAPGGIVSQINCARASYHRDDFLPGWSDLCHSVYGKRKNKKNPKCFYFLVLLF